MVTEKKLRKKYKDNKTLYKTHKDILETQNWPKVLGVIWKFR